VKLKRIFGVYLLVTAAFMLRDSAPVQLIMSLFAGAGAPPGNP